MESTDLLKRNRELYDNMKELAIKQEKLALNEEIVELINLSRKRENLKKEIERNNKLYHNSDRDKSRRSQINYAISSEITEVIRSIQEVDKRVEKLILEKKDNLITDAKKIRKGKVAVKGYVLKNRTTPRFVSKKG